MSYPLTVNLKRRSVRTALAALTAMVVYLLCVSGASAGVDSCYANGFCIWSGTEYEGTIWQYNIDEYVQNHWFSAGAGANKAQSFYNRRVHITWVSNEWVDGAPGGVQACITPGAAIRNLADYYYPGDYKANKAIASLVLSETNTECPAGWEFDPIPGAARPAAPSTGSGSNPSGLPSDTNPSGLG
jgi:hypothetical protein